MAEVIRMPLLSDTMTEGKIVTWNKNVGDKVKSDDVLADVETDKATMEVTGYADGTLLYIGVPEGKAAKINQIIAIVGKEGEDYKSLLEEEAKNAPVKEEKSNEKISAESKPETVEVKPQSADNATTSAKAEKPETDKQEKISLPEGAKEIRMPLLSDTMTEGKIVSWNKKVGDSVKSDDVLADVETDKATMEVVGYEEGTLLYIGVEAGQAAKINQIIAIVGKEGTDVSAYVAGEKDQSKNEQQGTTDKQQPTPDEKDPAIEEKQETGKQEINNGTDSRIKASPLAKKWQRKRVWI